MKIGDVIKVKCDTYPDVRIARIVGIYEKGDYVVHAVSGTRRYCLRAGEFEEIPDGSSPALLA